MKVEQEGQGQVICHKVKRMIVILHFDEEVPEIFEHLEKTVLELERRPVHWPVR